MSKARATFLAKFEELAGPGQHSKPRREGSSRPSLEAGLLRAPGLEIGENSPAEGRRERGWLLRRTGADPWRPFFTLIPSRLGGTDFHPGYYPETRFESTRPRFP